MRVNLLHPANGVPRVAVNGDRAFGDLGMESLYAAMAADDQIVLESVRTILPATVVDPEVIRHRQAVLADCCAHPAVIRKLFEISVEPTRIQRWPVGVGRRSGGKLMLALQPLTDLITCLRRLRALCEQHAALFSSPGLSDLMTTVIERFDDDYLDAVEATLATLYFEHGVHIGAGLGTGNKITNIVLREPIRPRRGRFGLDRRSGRAFEPIEDPEARSNPGLNPVKQLKDRALIDVAEVVSYAADHVHDFFLRLRTELAFYIGCLNLRDRLTQVGLPTCLPAIHAAGTPRLRCTGLRDITLSLAADRAVIGNDVDADTRSLLVVTGANNGGKSTFLRSLGAAQLMMQCGMFVIADSFESDIRDGVFTHFVTDEDRTMAHGKLVDELVRMRSIVDRIGPNSLLLCNESFASTSERDASRIAAPLIDALVDAGVKIVFVTHLYEFAHQRDQATHSTDLFLRAGHLPNGSRTFHITPGTPEPGSHADEIFRQVFDRAGGSRQPG
ncbi:MAG: mismatch repair protein [Nocardia sp.]|uniref:MutS-related protein n=1 Tax=Nocardia sp. TaxID=1821 RepID=UPI0026119291|nr:DNA mismatch repair protein [Nocardia sp.]MCU1641407.1 mismatch repair protein [Nocardia sp.]